jgi:hypothetical protein
LSLRAPDDPELPPHVEAEVQRILDGEARRMLDEADEHPATPVIFDLPVIHCRRVHGREVDLLQFACPHCCKVHTHGAGEHGSPVGSGDGHRVAHCDGGPFASSGYVLREVA